MPSHMAATQDQQYDRQVVKGVDVDAMHFIEGGSLGLEQAPSKVAPGDVVRLYGKGFGFPVRGVAVEQPGGRLRVLRYETEADWHARVERERAEQDAKDRAAFEAVEAVATRRGRIAALPLVFQARIGRLTGADTDGRPWSWLPYELFVCEQAVVIEQGVPSEDLPRAEFERFRALPWEEQKALVPGIDDGHSGNTFGMACVLAYQLRMSRHDPEWAASAANMPGSLAVLGGPV